MCDLRVLIVDEDLSKRFDCDRSIQSAVGGEIHLRKHSLSEDPLNLITLREFQHMDLEPNLAPSTLNHLRDGNEFKH